MSRFTAFLAILLIAATLSACGKKPEVMEAPVGADPLAYPRSYPDVRTDPDGIYQMPSNLPPQKPQP
jgi:hypothetical protein